MYLTSVIFYPRNKKGSMGVFNKNGSVSWLSWAFAATLTKLKALQ